MSAQRPAQLVCLFALCFGTCALAQETEKPTSELSTDELQRMSLQELMNTVVVTASKQEQLASEAPSIISVITENQIRTYGYRTVAEALRHVPGLYVRDDLIHPNVSMRGIDSGPRAWSRDLKVMINGQPVSYRSDTSNWLGPELIAMDAIARIEVLRGPASALYGANAFLGVINIITKKPSQTQWGSATLEGGVLKNPEATNPQGRVDLLASHSTQLKGESSLDYLLAASVDRADRSGLRLPESSPHFSETGPKFGATPGSDITSRGDLGRSYSVFGFVQLSRPSLGDFRVEGDFSQFERSGEFTDWSVLTHQNTVAQRQWTLRAQYRKTLASAPIDLNANLAIAQGETTGDNRLQLARDAGFWVKKVGGYVGYDASFEMVYRISERTSLTLNSHLSVDNHNLPSIFTVRGENDQEVESPSFIRGNKRFITGGLLAQLLLKPVDRLSTVLGISYDRHNIYGRECSLASCPSLNSRLGAVYSFLKSAERSVYAKALFGTSFKAPAAELIYGTPYVTAGIAGNRGLQPETARTFELALGADLQDHLSILVNGFYNLVHGKVEYIQTGYFTRAVNSSDLQSLGAEVSVMAQQGAFSSFANVSWQWTQAYRCLLQEGDICTQLKEFNSLYPSFVANAGVSYRILPAKLVLALTGNLVGDRWASQSNRLERLPSSENAGYDFKAYQIPRYLLLDFTVSTRDFHPFQSLGETVLALKVRNLLNQRATEPGFSGIDIPGLGPSVSLTLKQGF